MNTPPEPSLSSPSRLQPWLFLAGVVAGLVGMALAGHWAAANHRHVNFTRLFGLISPEGSYFPTLDEMCNLVRQRARPDQVVVIVGGNSIFHGVGQPAGKLWTSELQRQLGDGYVVVNLALRGAIITDGGAIVAETLRDEYPKLLYVGNALPFHAPHPAGLEPYDYLMREARARGLLVDYPPRDQLLAEHRAQAEPWSKRFEETGVAYTDRFLRFRDFWNWVGYNYLFTVPTALNPPDASARTPRRVFQDPEPDFADIPFSVRFPPQYFETEMRIVRAIFESCSEPEAAGGWRIRPASRDYFVRVARGAWPEEMKRRTLIMLSRNSPFYTGRLTAEQRAQEDFVYAEAIRTWESIGCRAADYGRDFAVEDFGDRTHLSVSGGQKLAGIVADELRRLAADLGYVNRSSR